MIMNVDIMKCRLIRESSLYYGKIKSTSDAQQIIKALDLAKASEEYFYIVCVNAKGEVTGVHQISHEDLASSIVHPREVFKRACINNAAGIVCFHNHPSGDTTPSSQDRAATNRLKQAGELLGIPVIDHIIVGDDFLSFKAEGLL